MVQGELYFYFAFLAQLFQPHHGPRIDSASNRIEYQNVCVE
jgi:hypothetical protein